MASAVLAVIGERSTPLKRRGFYRRKRWGDNGSEVVASSSTPVPASLERWSFNESMFNCKQCQLEPAGSAGLVEDVRDMMLDRLFADAELPGNFLIGAAGYDGVQDNHLALCQTKPAGFSLAGGFSCGQSAHGALEIGHASGEDPVLAFHHSIDAAEYGVGCSVLEDDAVDSPLERLNGIAVFDTCGEQNHAGGGRRTELSQNTKSGES